MDQIKLLGHLLELLFKLDLPKAELMTYYRYLASKETKNKISVNKLYDVRDFANLKTTLLKIKAFDYGFFWRCLEPETKGLRLWEYGSLLTNVSLKGKKVLDIGVGTSLLPAFMTKMKARVTALDLPQPLEQPDYKYVSGSMLKLPFRNSSFDRVLCISVMEHLDADYPSNQPVSRKTFLSRTHKGILEMGRVCKRGGVVFVTTEFHLNEAKEDRWQNDIPYRGIGGSYCEDDLKLFLQWMAEAKLKPVGKTDFNLQKLRKDNKRANFRGRDFTTISFLFKKI